MRSGVCVCVCVLHGTLIVIIGVCVYVCVASWILRQASPFKLEVPQAHKSRSAQACPICDRGMNVTLQLVAAGSTGANFIWLWVSLGSGKAQELSTPVAAQQV